MGHDTCVINYHCVGSGRVCEPMVVRLVWSGAWQPRNGVGGRVPWSWVRATECERDRELVAELRVQVGDGPERMTRWTRIDMGGGFRGKR